jgi:hypothetical protein
MEIDVALVAFHVRVVLPFGAMVIGLAVSATVAGGSLVVDDAFPLPHPAAISKSPIATNSTVSFRMFNLTRQNKLSAESSILTFRPGLLTFEETALCPALEGSSEMVKACAEIPVN